MSYRTLAFNTDLAVRGGDGDGRTIVGMAVPFGVAVDTPDIGREMFAKGAFARAIGHGRLSKIKLCVAHNKQAPIGVCTLLAERDDGLHAEFRVSKTHAGDEALEQVRDGTLDELSIGFVPQDGRRDGDTYVHTGVLPREVSLVPWGVYGHVGAEVLAVRGEQAGTPRLDAVREVLARLDVTL